MYIQKFRSILGQHPIAYMSAEFALDDRLPMYSGGLGVLAGDVIREANDMCLPLVGVGLLYKEGYFTQVITHQAKQRVEYTPLDIKRAPIQLIVDIDDQPILISIPIQGDTLYAQIWEYRQGDVYVYFLDTDIPANNNSFRFITRQLYGGNYDNRILQEIVLGIGGVRALLTLGIHPSIYHLNESHSAFAIFEIIHHYMNEYQMTFDQAYEYGKNKIVFTNHTLLAAGNEVFSRSMVASYVESYANELGVPIDHMLKHGIMPNNSEHFGLTQLAITMACRMNTVSKIHCEQAKELWPSAMMPSITNGVHLPTWISADIKVQTPEFDQDHVEAISDDELWTLHHMAKHRLIDEVKYQTGYQLNQDHLILTWARRMTSYKRPDLLFQDMKMLQSLISDTKMPLQVLIAGKAHPHDIPGQEYIHQILKAIQEYNLQGRVIFV
ncbi:MAG TPA: alpha-glucan family phosphorylase, partial [Patescibacteria group bacterium]|nr:alpha-glucan family phosphorylase [Patescibacteria group bacterium]